MVPGGGPGDRLSAGGRRAGKQREPPLPAHGVGNTGRSGPGQIVLLDLWGKLDRPGAVYADITWVGFTGSAVPAEAAAVFDAAREARDAAIALVSGPRAGRTTGPRLGGRPRRPRGDRSGRLPGTASCTAPATALGEEVHGNGVHMDDYETHDERRLIAGTGFTIEPGIYLDDFGVRTEINMHVGSVEAAVTGPLQKEIAPLG